ncbi:hypothetical protein L0U85_11975 [Glycomyces sp. L485]|uniref:hypothetical protein n=1 Tax=Glycomyces sp. L485 TaxID=2909235 RepID=UPI001F4A7724|nr:hypothetical protein [Glycomyces sp. L485]MCH7231562.1 hypothetical protein [Glycomyces sp. L485]
MQERADAHGEREQRQRDLPADVMQGGSTPDLTLSSDLVGNTLTTLEGSTGYVYSITATNIGLKGLKGIPGSHTAQFIDFLARHHAMVEDRVRCNKAMGLRNLPSQSWPVNEAWMLAANIAADLDAWTRLLGCAGEDELEAAEPDSIRTKLYAIGARLAATPGPGPSEYPTPGRGSNTSAAAGSASPPRPCPAQEHAWQPPRRHRGPANPHQPGDKPAQARKQLRSPRWEASLDDFFAEATGSWLRAIRDQPSLGGGSPRGTRIREPNPMLFAVEKPGGVSCGSDDSTTPGINGVVTVATQGPVLSNSASTCPRPSVEPSHTWTPSIVITTSASGIPTKSSIQSCPGSKRPALLYSTSIESHGGQASK